MNKLQELLLDERAKTCAVLNGWCRFLTKELELSSGWSEKISENEAYLQDLAGSKERLPSNAEQMIKTQNRTFVQIQQDLDYESSPASVPSYASNYGSQYDSTPEPPRAGHPRSNSKTAIALYDYSSTEHGDLNFYAGDVITITKDADDNGWCEGYTESASGLFPASYVEVQ